MRYGHTARTECCSRASQNTCKKQKSVNQHGRYVAYSRLAFVVQSIFWFIVKYQYLLPQEHQPSRIEISMQLLPELQAAVLACLPPNEQALTGRLVNRDACMRLVSNSTAQFRLPLPPAACDAAWRPHLHQARKQLTFGGKLSMLSAAAASGCKTNLELAWGLLRPGLFPELLKRPQGYRALAFYDDKIEGLDPGTAAVRAGHAAAVLPWLVSHGCPLHPDRTMEAAAQHCDLAGLQAAWQLLGYSSRAVQDDAAEAAHHCALARAAGLSGGDRATAKLAWLCSVVPAALLHSHRTQLLAAAAVGAAAAGSVPVLHWLRGQGLDLPSTRASDARGIRVLWAAGAAPWAVVLAAALRGGHVAVADWLVDEAGCPLPSEETKRSLVHVWVEAAEGGHVEALSWLLGRGMPAYEGFALYQAARKGHLDAARFLRHVCNPELTEGLFVEAAGSRSVPTAAWLLQAGCPMDPIAYVVAAQAGDGDMVAWLALEAGCPWEAKTLGLVMGYWPPASEAGRRDQTQYLQVAPNPQTRQALQRGLQQAVQALEEAGCLTLDTEYKEVWSALDAPARRGDTWLLRRLHEQHGVRCGLFTLREAARGGCEAVLEWLVGIVGRVGMDTDPYPKAGRNGDLVTLESLQRLGVEWYSDVLSAAELDRVPLPVLRWLVERGAPWNAEAAEAVEKVAGAAKRKGEYEDSVAWLEARLGREVRRAGSEQG